MLQHNPHGRAVFNRISKGQKTRRKQAAVALGRKVLCWCWAMLRDGREWQVPTATTTLMPGTEQPHRMEALAASVTS